MQCQVSKNTDNFIEWKRKGFFESDCRAWKDESVSGTLTTNGKMKILLKTNNKRLLGMLDKIDLSQTQAIDIYNQSTHQEMHAIKTTIDTSNMSAVTQGYRIRKLTPKECFRLMGVKDDDFNNIAQNQSNASLYHLAGDSIVVDVLMAIFGNMIKESNK